MSPLQSIKRMDSIIQSAPESINQDIIPKSNNVSFNGSTNLIPSIDGENRLVQSKSVQQQFNNENLVLDQKPPSRVGSMDGLEANASLP